MALEPKRCDRSKRHDDRYLFLETILSARQKLLISFVGQSIQDGTRRPPSVLVSELMDYIDRGYSTQGDRDGSLPALSDMLTIKHHLQPFHPDYFLPQSDTQQNRLFSYSAENCEAAAALRSAQQKITPAFSAPLPPPPEEHRQIELQELVRFFSHPARYLMVRRLGIAPIEESLTLEKSEPFTVKGLARYKLENDILAHLLAGRDCNELYLIKKAAGELPHGRMGKILFGQLVSHLQAFHKTLAPLLSGQELQALQINLTIGDYRITGQLDHVGTLGQVQFRYATMKPKDVIRSWISHLTLNSLPDNGEGRIGIATFHAGKDGIYKYVPATDSRLELQQLLDLYWQGLSEPLYFFPGPSYVFAREIHKGKTEQEALRKAFIEWEGNEFYKKGEKNDPYNLLCCKNIDLANPLFIEQAKKFFLPALAHREKYV